MTLYEAAMEATRKANLRMEAATRALEATLLGTPEQHEEAERARRHAAVMDQLSTYDTPPLGTRIPGWKRRRWARRLLGR